jgi:hypothetical protein
MTEAYPLKWPTGWPRHQSRERDTRFRGPTYRWDRVYGGLMDELRRIGATNVVVSTNQPVRNDGLPYAQQRNIFDPGVAVYFARRKKALVMAQDRFDTIIGNMRSLAISIEGLRQMERHGGATMMERAFDGFAALPPPEDCWSILDLDEIVVRRMRAGERFNGECRTLIQDFFKKKVREQHGTGADMDRLVKARDEALEKISAA